MATKIRGIEGMKHAQLDFAIQRGAKYVLFQYCSARPLHRVNYNVSFSMADGVWD
jgi:hypothetical protein